MPWATLSINPIDPGVGDRWQGYALPPVPGVLSYGFRVGVDSAIPDSWQLGGYWGCVYTCDGFLCATPTIPFLLFNDPGGQPIRVLGGDEISFAPGTITSLDLIVSVNRWVPVSVIEILALT